MSARTRFFTLAVAFAFVGALSALPAAADVYTITLANGTTFQTRYQPEDASWDPAKLVFLDELGNRLSLAKSDVVSIATDLETRGFGHMLNSTTMALGWAPNDALDPDSDEGKAALQAEAQRAMMQGSAQPVYNQQQFVEPGALSGLPVWMTGINAVPQVQPSQPSSPPAP